MPAVRLSVELAMCTDKVSMEAAVPWTSQEFCSTHERVELLGDSHLKVETRSRDLNTAVTSRIY